MKVFNNPACSRLKQYRNGLCVGASLLAIMVAWPIGVGLAAPEDGVVSAGSITIDQNNLSTTTITQFTDRGIIDWRSFDVNSGELVQFNQPNVQSITVNRVKNSPTNTTINGTIKANGNVVILNENGVMFGENSTIDVGGLAVSTSDLFDDSEFMTGGAVRFKSGNNPNAGVQNFGNITARTGGLVGLVSPNVQNNGIIQAKLGKVQIASADIATIDFAGDGLIQIDISQTPTKQLIKNSGVISADGGEVLLSANTARSIVDSVIETDGTIKSNTILDSNNIIKKGKIQIDAGAGSLQMSGVVTVDGDQIMSGGQIYLKGKGISAGGLISASGSDGGQIDIQAGSLSLAEYIIAEGLRGNGGSVNINATGNVFETSTSRIFIDGLVNGGTLIYKSDRNLVSSGRYYARGQAGVGGNIDITGGSVKFLSAQLYTDGWTRGGRIRIGGEYQGGKNLTIDELPNAQITTIDGGTIISANGTGYVAGGGEIIIWSDEDTLALGTITATPGTVIGQGGFVEVSSNGVLNYGATIQTGVGSRAGTVLLDPKNIVIADSTSFSSNAIIMGRGMPTGKNVTQALGSLDQFGTSVSLDGNRLAVGSIWDDGPSNASTNTGAVYLYSFTDAAFNGGVLESIIGAGYTGGKNINQTLGTDDYFGRSVSLDGNRLAVGADSDDGNANSVSGSGAVYLYTFTDSAFSGGALQATIGAGYTGGKNINIASTLGSAELFGYSVSLDGNRLAVGSQGDSGPLGNPASGGSVYLFTFADSEFSSGVVEGIIGSSYTGGKNINQTLEMVDAFGSSVSLDGNRLAVGASHEDGFGNTVSLAGAVYLYTFTDAAFSGGALQAIIGNGYTGGKNINQPLELADQFGQSVSLNGNRLAVGAPIEDGNANVLSNSGAVYLYTFTDSEFSGGVLEARIGAGYTGGKNIDITSNLNTSDYFGWSVSLDGNRLAIGAQNDDGFGNTGIELGGVYLYNFNDFTFSGGALQATIGNGYLGGNNIDVTALDNNDQFGNVSLDGNRLAVGAFNDDGNGNSLTDSGAVYLYSFLDSAFNGAVLESIIGNGYTGGKNINQTLDSGDFFGSSISLDGNRLAVGAGDDGNGNSANTSGTVYLYSFTDSVFSGGALQARIGNGYTGGKNINQSLDSNDWFGGSVSLDGNRLAVGAFDDDGNGNTVTNSGVVYLYTFTDSVFSGGVLQARIGNGYLGGNNVNVTALENFDSFGSSVSLDGNRLAVGALADGGNANSLAQSGAVYLYSFLDSAFNGAVLESIIGNGYTGGKNINQTLDGSDFFAASVSLDGNRLAVGTVFDDGNANSRTDSGAVYLYNFSDASFSGGALDATIGAGYTGGNNINIASSLDANDWLGSSVSLNNGRLVVGAAGFDGFNNANSNSGGMFIFRVGSGDPVANGNAFATLSSSTLGITPAALTALLNTPQNVILQANNDIFVNNAIIANNPSGNAGSLTLQAGRSILINANITTDNGNLFIYANEDLSSGVVDAQRDAGAAVIQMAAGISINAGTGNVTFRLEDGTGKTNSTSGNIILNTITAANILARTIGTSSDITLNGTINASGTGTALTLASARNLINNAGASAFVTPNGRWLSYSTNPSADTLGGLTSGFRRFSCTYGGSCPSFVSETGNGFLYSATPLLTVTPNAISNIQYGSSAPNLTGYSYSVSGYLGSDGGLDTVSGPLNGSTLYTVSSNAGTNQNINYLSGTLTSTMGYGFTYANNSNAFSVLKRDITATIASKSRAYGDANPTWLNASDVSYSNLVNGDTASVMDTVAFTATTPTATSNAGTTQTITITSFNDNNYNLTSTVAGILSVIKRDITAVVNNSSRNYGDANPIFNWANVTWNGLVNSQTGAVLDALTVSAPSATSISNAGTNHAINISGFNDNNYNLLSSVAGILTVNDAPLTLIANSYTRNSGENNPVFDFNAIGLKNGELKTSILNVLLSTTATPSSANGLYDIILTGGSINNYTITRINGQLNVINTQIIPPVVPSVADIARVLNTNLFNTNSFNTNSVSVSALNTNSVSISTLNTNPNNNQNQNQNQNNNNVNSIIPSSDSVDKNDIIKKDMIIEDKDVDTIKYKINENILIYYTRSIFNKFFAGNKKAI